MAEHDATEDEDPIENTEELDAVNGDDDVGLEQDENPELSADEDPQESENEADDAAKRESVRRRRAIEDRAEDQRRERDRLAAETAAATVRATISETEAARRRADNEREERDLRAAMSDEQRITYDMAKEIKVAKDGSRAAGLMAKSSADSNKFGRLLMRKPEYVKYEDEVERRHQATIAQGGFIDRQEILAHLIGTKAIAAESSKQQKNQARGRINEQRSRAGGGGTVRGNVSSRAEGGGRTVSQRAEREDWSI